MTSAPTTKAMFQSNNIHRIFEKQVLQNPTAVALTCDGKTMTYRELNSEANRLAHHLKKCGVESDTPVGLCFDRTPQMIIAILGVLKAGGAYVPVDLAYPKERLGFMLSDSKAPVLLTMANLAASLPEHGAQTIHLDSHRDTISKESAENLEGEIDGSSAAYIIYTSGSTGKPKGVTVTHHNTVRLFSATDGWFGFGAQDVWTLFHSYAFDFSVWEIWGALLFGGRLVIVPYLVSRSPAAFYELLGKEKVTVLNQTPSAFRQLIWAEDTAAQKQNLQLRTVVFGGEALELQSLRPWFDRHGDQKPQLVNMYGITETTVHVTYRVITRKDVEADLGSVIGIPIPDLQLYLLDENLKPVPVGEAGEIFVGGEGVARGYLNRPELTEARFLADLFSKKAGARLYRSGDLARYLESGELEYLGRMDHQVKIRGFRIELGEIESALNKHDAIRESVVIAHESGTSGDKRLVSYLVSKQKDKAPSISELREYLKQHIPEYMVPAVFLFLDAMPLTPNGKVDRRALPSPESAVRTREGEYVAPVGETQRKLAEIWEKVLGVESIGIRDNFFELGGDSITSISVLSKAQQSGLVFSVQQLFQNPTVEGLAASISQSKPAVATQKSKPFSLISPEDRAKLPKDVVDAYPMIHLQTGMFYYNELNPLSAVYHDVFSFRIHAVLDEEKLREALQRLVARHPVLRTSFHISGYQEPMQLVHEKVKVPFTVHDVRHFDDADQDRLTIEWINTEKRNPFDRTVAPLIRFHTQLQTENSFQFIVSFHHVYLDGWSLAALLTEVFQDYSALRSNSGETIAAPQVAYRDFVALEKQTIADPKARKFWLEKYEGAPITMLPRWPKALCEGGHEQFRGPELMVSTEVFEGIKKIAQLAGVPLKTVLLTAHQRVMSLIYGQKDVTSGLVCNGRPEEIDGEKLIGLFLNTLPIRTKMEGGTWVELVKQTFQAEQEIMAHRRMPLAEVQKIHGGQPLFEAAFDFVHFHVYKNLEGYKDLGFMEGHYFEANNLTTLTTFMLDITSTQLQMHLDYDPNVIARKQVEQISEYYIHTLEQMAADPAGKYNSGSALSAEEKENLTTHWNNTQYTYPDTRCIHQLFEEQVDRSPKAIAITFGGEQWTYEALDNKANAIAEFLLNNNIPREALVGLFVERSPEMVAGLLGILKAGAAYVPLDPIYPKERLEQIIQDSKMATVLTQDALVTQLPAGLVPLLKISKETKKATRPAIGNVTGRNLAYTIYTSGSTGKPKGVQIEHRSVVNLLLSVADRTNTTSNDNLLAVTTISFDIAGLEIFMPLLKGAVVTLATREQSADGIQLSKLIETSKATVMQATPATWRLLIEAGWKGSHQLKIFTGGEALPQGLAGELLSRSSEVWNLYGPTETTIWSTAWKVVANQPVVIGTPLANTQVYVLNELMQPLPIGTVGELHIGGDGLARGYLNRPDLTGDKFVAVTILNQSTSRLYKTGDLARFLPDGQLECLGRIDHQVKLRGYRIELGDVENAMRKHPSVKEAVVLAREDAAGEKLLAAYYTAEGNSSISDLREFLKTKLPDYMVPAAFVPLEKFPLTANGKIDVKSLPSPAQSSAMTTRKFTAPTSPIEIEVAGIWQEVLRVNEIGIDDNFFDIGGHSLKAIQCIVRIRENLGAELTLTALIENPTIRGISDVVLMRLLGDDKESEQLLAEVTQMSTAEAKHQLTMENVNGA